MEILTIMTWFAVSLKKTEWLLAIRVHSLKFIPLLFWFGTLLILENLTSRTVLQAYKVKMVEVRKVIEALFVTLQEDKYVLIRIQAVVALVTAMFFVMFVVDFYRCRSRSKLLTTIFKAVDGLSDQIVVYLLGAMQSASFENQMFPVWAVVLVSLRASLGYLSGYGIPDRERRLTEVGNVVKFMGAGVLNGTRALEFTKPLWSLWAILLLRSIYRPVAHDRAIRSLWHGRSSEFIPEYMRHLDRTSDREQANSSAGGEQVNGSAGGRADNLAGDRRHCNSDDCQKYLIYGESDQEINLKRPRYTLQLKVVNDTKLITLDKISGCSKPLLSSNDNKSRRYKDISLAFTLSRLLRCRFEDVTLLSNWTRLLLVCKYVQLSSHVLKEGLISSFFDSKIATAWHGQIDQYDFLKSCNYKPSFSKLTNAITLGKTPEKLDGRKSGKAIKIPDGVKPAILQALRRIGLNNPQLPRVIPSLTGERFQRYEWACLALHTCSEVILVWHIATSICEIKLAQKYDLTNHGFLQSAWSYLKNMCVCTSQPYLVDKNILQDGELKDNYLIANSLSRYCAYLQVFLNALLPDSFVVPELIFRETLRDARKELKDCDSKQCRYNKLMAIVQEAAPNNVDRRLGMNIVQQGATLGKALIENEDEESRWKILAGVWADLLVHVAPSWNAADHKYTLESGGEFITLIWALLWHCGIEKSNLWNTDEVPP